MKPVGQKLAQLFVADNPSETYQYGTPWELLYDADGSDIDWLYREVQAIPFVIELGSRTAGFHPNYEQGQSIVHRARKSWTYLLDRVQESSVYISLDEPSSAEGLTVKARSLAADHGESLVHHFRADGSCQIILIPGMYEIQVHNGDGEMVSKQNVIIGQDRVNIRI